MVHYTRYSIILTIKAVNAWCITKEQKSLYIFILNLLKMCTPDIVFTQINQLLFKEKTLLCVQVK